MLFAHIRVDCADSRISSHMRRAGAGGRICGNFKIFLGTHIHRFHGMQGKGKFTIKKQINFVNFSFVRFAKKKTEAASELVLNNA